MSNTKEMLINQCQAIANDLEYGFLNDDCAIGCEDGCDSYDECYCASSSLINQDGDTCDFDHCTSAYAYLKDCLDIEFTVDMRGDCLAATFTVATGGPRIDINTREKLVKGYWGNDRVDIPYIDGINVDSTIEEFFEQTK